ncbi:MAG: ABC transporter permease [Gammaproteobacteria bacterium]|nr:ABC transporter permease [Gammaproteobacteria bacterium]
MSSRLTTGSRMRRASPVPIRRIRSSPPSMKPRAASYSCSSHSRIALAERGRELASMRVLGFTRGEISFILLGELAILTVLSLPFGLILGWSLCWIMIRNVQQDIFRIPLVVEPSTYAAAAATVIVASILSSLVVRSKLDHLDLVAVLKAPE